MSELPFQNLVIVERSETLAGRLACLLFADQGAKVYICRKQQHVDPSVDEYLDRNKFFLMHPESLPMDGVDLIVVDGQSPVDRHAQQIVLRVCAALPGDKEYGYLPDDCSDDLLNALTGFYTDMSITGKYLGRPVIYTPLPLCSIYAAVDGANAVAAALVERLASGQGREILISRIAAGLSAIGALVLTSEGLDEHLKPADITGLPEDMSPAEKQDILNAASMNADKQLELEQQLIPLAAPYYTADKKLILPLCAANRRLASRLCQHLGIWDALEAEGVVDVNPYDPDNQLFANQNLADSMALNYHGCQMLYQQLKEAFAGKPAEQWFHELSNLGIPCEIIQSFSEWKKDKDALDSHLFAEVKGLDHFQLGRAAWIKSAQPYPSLKACQVIDYAKPMNKKMEQSIKPINSLPLSGYLVLDLANVVAGPNCGRMLAELGAEVIKVDPINPQHAPVIMCTWAAESGVNKKSMILDFQQDDGREVMNRLLKRADIILFNKLDKQIERMGLSQEQLMRVNPHIIGLQLTARGGEKISASRHHPGYDPSIQGWTGIMDRFGPEGCPTYHGVASCVDYLCGYLGVFAGLTALYHRQNCPDKPSDWAESSLASAASLTQLLFQQHEASEQVTGPNARGASENSRIYKVKDGWIYAEANQDISDKIQKQNQTEALALLAKENILATPVMTVRQLADTHRTFTSKTIRFIRREKEGWVSENFAPSWFVFDGKTIPEPQAASRIGTDAKSILMSLGYGEKDIEQLYAKKIIGPVEWNFKK